MTDPKDLHKLALLLGYEALADPERVLDPVARRTAAEEALAANMRELALRSVAVRRRRMELGKRAERELAKAEAVPA